jgi:hypothetical protein
VIYFTVRRERLQNGKRRLVGGPDASSNSSNSYRSRSTLAADVNAEAWSVDANARPVAMVVIVSLSRSYMYRRSPWSKQRVRQKPSSQVWRQTRSALAGAANNVAAVNAAAAVPMSVIMRMALPPLFKHQQRLKTH